MKKIYLLLAAGTFVVSANAQRVSGLAGFNGQVNTKALKVANPTMRAAGDTLFFTDAQYFYGTGIDGTFGYTTEDIDGLPSTSTNNFPSPDWGTFYSLGAWDLMPGDVDSAFYFAATSWFNSPGQAHNWIEFGPINIPAAGATVSWWIKNNPAYRDGYEVLVNTTGMSSFDFVDPAIYSRADLYDGTTYPGDTTWTNVSVALPASYSGQAIYLGIHHNANDMDVLYMDGLLVTEAGPVGIAEANAGLSVSEVYPNPSSSIASFVVTANEASVMTYTVTDLSGRTVMTKTESIAAGKNNITLNAAALAAGIYNLNIVANGAAVAKKLEVIK